MKLGLTPTTAKSCDPSRAIGTKVWAMQCLSSQALAALASLSSQAFASLSSQTLPGLCSACPRSCPRGLCSACPRKLVLASCPRKPVASLSSERNSPFVLLAAMLSGQFVYPAFKRLSQPEIIAVKRQHFAAEHGIEDPIRQVDSKFGHAAASRCAG